MEITNDNRIVLIEVWERNGNLLLITGDGEAARKAAKTDDLVIRAHYVRVVRVKD